MTTHPGNPLIRIWLRTAAVLVLPLLALALPASAQQALTNVTVANVTPSGFSVVWRGQPGATADIRVFSDEAGTLSLEGKLGVESYPVHTGSPFASNAYERRQSKSFLRTKTSDHGLRSVRVSGCQPNTVYYYQLVSTSAVATNTLPVAGPFPSVTTSLRNSLVPDAVQILMDVQGLDVAGRIVTLTTSNTLSAIAAVVGDGCGTNQVIFNLADLVDLNRGGNFTPTGSLRFLAQVLGAGPDGGRTLTVPVEFTDAFRVTRSVLTAVSSELVALSVGSAVMRGGTTNSVPFAMESTITLGSLVVNLQIPRGHLTNLVLEAGAPEVDPARLSLQSTGPDAYRCIILPRAGQSLFADSSLVRLRFTALQNVPSAFVPLNVTSVTATKSDASAANVALFRPGRVVVVVNEPLLEAHAGGGPSRNLTLYGKPWYTYAIETASNLRGPWSYLTRVGTTALSQPLTLPAGPRNPEFYRAYETETHPPQLQIAGDAASNTVNLVLFGRTGTNYNVQSALSLSPPIQWRNVIAVSSTNSFRMIGPLAATNPATLYRVTIP